jgi:hypothetical protein
LSRQGSAENFFNFAKVLYFLSYIHEFHGHHNQRICYFKLFIKDFISNLYVFERPERFEKFENFRFVTFPIQNSVIFQKSI